jgi:hypothetical protein
VREYDTPIPTDGASGSESSARPRAAITTVALDRLARFLIAGCSNGAIRIYRWPLSGEYTEYLAHGGITPTSNATLPSTNASSGPSSAGIGAGAGAADSSGSTSDALTAACAVTAVAVSSDNRTLISTAEDGTLFVFQLSVSEIGANLMPASLSSSVGDSGSGLEAKLGGVDPNAQRLSTDTVLVAHEMVDETGHELRELRKMCEDMRSEMDYSLHLKDSEWQERLRQKREEASAEAAAEAARFEQLTRSLKETQRKLVREQDRVDVKHLEVMQRMEGAYETRLGRELERYDTLREEIGELEEQCELRVSGKQNAHEQALERLHRGANKTERDLRKQYEQLLEEAKYQDMVYRETLQQQEQEYESEVAKLIAAAEKELATERDKTSRLHAQVQRLNTQIVQHDKKMRELDAEITMTDEKITTQNQRNIEFDHQISEYTAEMEAQDQKLERAEKNVSDLNAKMSTLENFRFVLDQRVHELTAERAPLAEHTAGLDKKMYDAYDTLTEKYAEHKRGEERMEQTDKVRQTKTHQ